MTPVKRQEMTKKSIYKGVQLNAVAIPVRNDLFKLSERMLQDNFKKASKHVILNRRRAFEAHIPPDAIQTKFHARALAYYLAGSIDITSLRCCLVFDKKSQEIFLAELCALADKKSLQLLRDTSGLDLNSRHISEIGEMIHEISFRENWKRKIPRQKEGAH